MEQETNKRARDEPREEDRDTAEITAKRTKRDDDIENMGSHNDINAFGDAENRGTMMNKKETRPRNVVDETTEKASPRKMKQKKVTTTRQYYTNRTLPGSNEYLSRRIEQSEELRSKIPLVIEENPNDEVMLGIDEAGRGCVLGPMLYGASYWRVADKVTVEQLDFNDSKQLSASKREEMLSTLFGEGTRIGWLLTSISAAEISAKQTRHPTPVSLNVQSHLAARDLVRRALALGVNVRHVYVDTVGDPGYYQRWLESQFQAQARDGRPIHFDVRKKADAIFKVVGAASICAKVARDEFVGSCVDGRWIPWHWKEMKKMVAGGDIEEEDDGNDHCGVRREEEEGRQGLSDGGRSCWAAGEGERALVPVGSGILARHEPARSTSTFSYGMCVEDSTTTTSDSNGNRDDNNNEDNNNNDNVNVATITTTNCSESVTSGGEEEGKVVLESKVGDTSMAATMATERSEEMHNGERDEEQEEAKHDQENGSMEIEESNQSPPLDIGSGYPSDPKTKLFIAQAARSDRVFAFPSSIRFDWAPAKRLIAQHCVEVDWGEDDGADDAQQLTQFFAAKVSKVVQDARNQKRKGKEKKEGGADLWANGRTSTLSGSSSPTSDGLPSAAAKGRRNYVDLRPGGCTVPMAKALRKRTHVFKSRRMVSCRIGDTFVF